MHCFLVGFQTKPELLDGKLQLIPNDYRDNLVTGHTDYEDFFIGYVVLNQGINGIEPVNGPIDLLKLKAHTTVVAAILGLDPSTVQIADIWCDDAFAQEL